ncbi:TPA: hypothetical protein ACGDWI_002584, partial [Acinetobacter baumannii]
MVSGWWGKGAPSTIKSVYPKFFTWKVKGTKLFGLDIIGIERGVCDISGNDRCSDASHTVIIFDASTDKTRKEIKEKTRIDYGNLT